jgi:hypothetical protein
MAPTHYEPLGKWYMQEEESSYPYTLSMAICGWVENRDHQLCMIRGDRYQEGLNEDSSGSNITVRVL